MAKLCRKDRMKDVAKVWRCLETNRIMSDIHKGQCGPHISGYVSQKDLEARMLLVNNEKWLLQACPKMPSLPNVS